MQTAWVLQKEKNTKIKQDQQDQIKNTAISRFVFSLIECNIVSLGPIIYL